MSAGTFERFSSLRTFSGGWILESPSTEVLRNGAVGRMTAQFGIPTTQIYLDGDYAHPIGINDLPVGFEVLTAQMDLGLVLSASNALVSCLSYFLPVTYTEPPDAGFLTKFIIPPPTNAALFSIATLTIDGVTVVGPGTVTVVIGAGPIVGLEQVGISGTYDTLGFKFNINPAPGNIDVADIIVITSNASSTGGVGPGGAILDLSHVTITMACGTVVPIVQTPSMFVFAIPRSCRGAGASAVIATGDGTQFSGSVTLGTFTILTTNASGLYTITKGKTNDTLYQTVRDGSTRNVPIPSPFIKTGYIGE